MIEKIRNLKRLLKDLTAKKYEARGGHKAALSFRIRAAEKKIKELETSVGSNI